MDKTPRTFTIGAAELERLLAEEDWSDGLIRVTFTRDPGWVGFVRRDGTGLALKEPSHLEVFTLREGMKKANSGEASTEVAPPVSSQNEQYLWGV